VSLVDSALGRFEDPFNCVQMFGMKARVISEYPVRDSVKTFLNLSYISSLEVVKSILCGSVDSTAK
jgi:hypothetical protein